jgi:hypothetical protein
MVLEVEPEEAAALRPAIESHGAPPAAAAWQAPTERDSPSVIEIGGPPLDPARTLPEPELAVHHARVEIAPERRRPDQGPRNGPGSPLFAPSREADRAPIVRVTIGRVEVRAVQPAVTTQEATAPTPAWSPSVLSLDQYLEQRKGMWG